MKVNNLSTVAVSNSHSSLWDSTSTKEKRAEYKISVMVHIKDRYISYTVFVFVYWITMHNRILESHSVTSYSLSEACEARMIRTRGY